jgi:hypothetical protein
MDKFAEEIMNTARAIENVRKIAFDEGYRAGYQKAKRFAIHGISEPTGERQLDNDGHWDGEASVEINVKAIPTLTLDGKIVWVDLRLAMGLEVAEELANKLATWVQRIHDGERG